MPFDIYSEIVANLSPSVANYTIVFTEINVYIHSVAYLHKFFAMYTGILFDIRLEYMTRIVYMARSL